MCNNKYLLSLASFFEAPSLNNSQKGIIFISLFIANNLAILLLAGNMDTCCNIWIFEDPQNFFAH